MSEFARVAGAATASLSPRELSQMSHTPRNSNIDSNRSTPPTPQTAGHMHLDTKSMHLHGVSPLSATDGFSFSQSQGSEDSLENALTGGFSTTGATDQSWTGSGALGTHTNDDLATQSQDVVVAPNPNPKPSLIAVPVQNKWEQHNQDTQEIEVGAADKEQVGSLGASGVADTSSADDVTDWRVEDVCSWLSNQIHLPQYASTFRELGIDGGMLLHDLTNEDLDVLQVQ